MGKRKVTDEAYLTTPKLAQKCFDAVSARYSVQDFRLFVEPSAGDGVFLDLLPESRRIGIDLNPRRPDLIHQDFLLWAPENTDGSVMVIGNPPFGQRAALAIRFIQHACTFADVVAFILPRSFNKETFQNRVPKVFHLAYSMDCNEAFLVEGKEHHVKTVFQIWERGKSHREFVSRRSSHPHFQMKHAHLSRTPMDLLIKLRNEYDFTIPQVGTFTLKDSDVVDRGSHWFIQPCSPVVREIFERLDFTFLAGMNTAHASLSKADIVQAYEQALKRYPNLSQKIKNSKI